MTTRSPYVWDYNIDPFIGPALLSGLQASASLLTESVRAASFGVLLTVVFLSACVSHPSPAAAPEILTAPPDYYGAVLRFPDGRMLIQTRWLRPQVADPSHYYHLAEERLLQITLPDDPGCPLTEYRSPTPLPDGRLAMRKLCYGRWPDRPTGLDNASYLVAYDWLSGETENIVQTPLPFEAGRFSWNPTLTRGVQSIGSLLGTIYWLTPSGFAPINLELGSGTRSWSLADNLIAMEINPLDAAHLGIARGPAWSPDGRHIAFWASTDAIGRSGLDRARAAYDLYLLNLDSLAYRSILSGIRNPLGPTWSPDGQWLAFTGDIGISNDALWLASIHRSRLKAGPLR